MIYSILSRNASALLLGKAISLLASTEHGILVHLSISSSRSRNILTIFLLKRKKKLKALNAYLKTFREFMKLATASLSLLLCAYQGGRNGKKFGGDLPTLCPESASPDWNRINLFGKKWETNPSVPIRSGGPTSASFTYTKQCNET